MGSNDYMYMLGGGGGCVEGRGDEEQRKEELQELGGREKDSILAGGDSVIRRCGKTTESWGKRQQQAE